MRSVYIAGPYTAPDREGEDAHIKQAAEVAAEYIGAGYAVFCPHTHSCTIDRGVRHFDWDTWLTLDLYWLGKCDAIHMLPGWRDSKGAKLEYIAAKALGLEIRGDA
jgi:hypothetical protein